MTEKKVDFLNKNLEESYIYVIFCPVCDKALHIDTLVHSGEEICYHCGLDIKIVVRARTIT